MLAAGDLQPPVGYDDRWLLLAIASVLAVAAYYLIAWLVTRPRREPRARKPAAPREQCLAELDRIERSVTDGTMSAREAHQQISRVVRGFVTVASGLPAETMTLTSLRRGGPHQLAELVAVLYPPEFGPGDEPARRELATALAQARELVRTWT